MGGPIQAEYGRRYNEPTLCDEAAKQAIIMKEHIQDKNTGLMRHAWDPTKRAMWCDPVTGLAPECWGRALGWYVTAVLDIIEQLPENHGERERLAEIEREIIEAIARYQERETGMWYQVVNMGNRPDNWLETSCTALFAYAMAKGVRLGVLDERYLYRAFHAFYGITDIAVERFRDELLVQRVCIGTGVGTYNYYTNRPQSTNDLHGVGVFLLLCAELAKHERK
jgi:unsaturated rhamnogalacturonyl hydrolase